LIVKLNNRALLKTLLAPSAMIQ